MEEQNIQKAVVDANIEINHLRRNVQSLRDELEKQKIAEEVDDLDFTEITLIVSP